MKIVIEFENEKEREDFLTTIFPGPLPEGATLDSLEDQLLDGLHTTLGQQYLRLMQQSERAARRLNIEKLQKFRRNPKQALEAALVEKKGKK